MDACRKRGVIPWPYLGLGREYSSSFVKNWIACAPHPEILASCSQSVHLIKGLLLTHNKPLDIISIVNYHSWHRF